MQQDRNAEEVASVACEGTDDEGRANLPDMGSELEEEFNILGEVDLSDPEVERVAE